jgi:hypothetical protein
MNSVLGRYCGRVRERINIDSPPFLCLPYAYLSAFTQIVTCSMASVPCTGLLFSWFVVGIVGDDTWGACEVEEQATDFYLKTRAGSTSKIPCAFQIQIRSSVQYTACVMSKQLHTVTDSELMKGLDICVCVCVCVCVCIYIYMCVCVCVCVCMYVYEKSVCFQECLFCANLYTVTGM